MVATGNTPKPQDPRQNKLMTIDGLPTATIPQTWRYKANDVGYYALNSLHPTQLAGPAEDDVTTQGTSQWNDAALFRTGTRAPAGSAANGAAVIRDVLPVGNVLDTPWSTASQASAAPVGLGAPVGQGSAKVISDGTGAGWGLGGSTTWEANSPDTGAGSGLRVDPNTWVFGDVGAIPRASVGGEVGAGSVVTSAPGAGSVGSYFQDSANLSTPEAIRLGASTTGVFSAHGVPLSVYLEETNREMLPARAAPTSGGGRKRRRKRRKSRSKKGWAKRAPRGRARTRMLKKCGKKCFLGPKKSFPICAKRTCKINRKGVKAAYIRAKQWGKPRKSYKSKSKTVARRSRKRRKGSRPRHRRRVYTRVARKAKSLLRRMKR
jgi:hypothetical protein